MLKTKKLKKPTQEKTVIVLYAEFGDLKCCGRI